MLVIIPNQGSQPCIKHHSAATPTDSVLYPLRRFPVSFATDTGTLGYSQAQHLFADSFIGCPLAFDSGPHVDHAHQFTSWCTVTATRGNISELNRHRPFDFNLCARH